MATKLDKVTADPKPIDTNLPSAEPKAKAAPAVMLVLDTTARDGIRTHEMIVQGVVRSFNFEVGKGLPLPTTTAVKFLKHDAFKLVDEKGEVLEWQRRPKQPNELGAGETLKLADNETIARVDELSNGALLRRALELPLGEKFSTGSDRQEMIAFLVAVSVAANKSRAARPENGPNEFTPAEELDEEAA